MTSLHRPMGIPVPVDVDDTEAHEDTRSSSPMSQTHSQHSHPYEPHGTPDIRTSGVNSPDLGNMMSPIPGYGQAKPKFAPRRRAMGERVNRQDSLPDIRKGMPSRQNGRPTGTPLPVGAFIGKNEEAEWKAKPVADGKVVKSRWSFDPEDPDYHMPGKKYSKNDVVKASKELLEAQPLCAGVSKRLVEALEGKGAAGSALSPKEQMMALHRKRLEGQPKRGARNEHVYKRSPDVRSTHELFIARLQRSDWRESAGNVVLELPRFDFSKTRDLEHKCKSAHGSSIPAHLPIKGNMDNPGDVLTKAAAKAAAKKNRRGSVAPGGGTLAAKIRRSSIVIGMMTHHGGGSPAPHGVTSFGSPSPGKPHRKGKKKHLGDDDDALHKLRPKSELSRHKPEWKAYESSESSEDEIVEEAPAMVDLSIAEDEEDYDSDADTKAIAAMIAGEAALPPLPVGAASNDAESREHYDAVAQQRHLSKLRFFDLYHETMDGDNDSADGQPLKSGRHAYLTQTKLHHQYPNPLFFTETNVESVVLKNAGFHDANVDSLAAALRYTTTITSLDLEGNNMGGKSMAKVVRALSSNGVVKKINLARTGLGADGVALLPKALKRAAALQELQLAGNRLSDHGLPAVVEIAKTHQALQRLSLAKNGLTDKAWELLQEVLWRGKLRDLDLSWNMFTPQIGTEFLLNVSRSRTLTSLRMAWNGLRDSGCALLVAAVAESRCLRSLDLSFNRIGEQGVASIADAIVIENSPLRHVDLNGNWIGENGLMALLRAASMTVDTEYGLERCGCDTPGMSVVKPRGGGSGASNSGGSSTVSTPKSSKYVQGQGQSSVWQPCEIPTVNWLCVERVMEGLARTREMTARQVFLIEQDFALTEHQSQCLRTLLHETGISMPTINEMYADVASPKRLPNVPGPTGHFDSEWSTKHDADNSDD